MMDSSSMTNPQRRDKSGLARVLLDPARRRVADLMRSRPRGYWTIDEIAAHQRMHRTVAFDHLEALVDAGLATKVSIKRGRGRPSNAYRYSGVPLELSYPTQRTPLLARVLALAVSRSTDGHVQARQIARDAGREIGAVNRLGGDYEESSASIHARTCIFGSTCPSSRDVVCEVHAALIEGALEAEGRPRSLTPEGPDGVGGCGFRFA
jgi:predicted ArsR family transcriptional regulator